MHNVSSTTAPVRKTNMQHLKHRHLKMHRYISQQSFCCVCGSLGLGPCGTLFLSVARFPSPLVVGCGYLLALRPVVWSGLTSLLHAGVPARCQAVLGHLGSCGPVLSSCWEADFGWSLLPPAPGSLVLLPFGCGHSIWGLPLLLWGRSSWQNCQTGQVF